MRYMKEREMGLFRKQEKRWPCGDRDLPDPGLVSLLSVSKYLFPAHSVGPLWDSR